MEQRQQHANRETEVETMTLSVVSRGKTDGNVAVANLLQQLQDFLPAVRWLYVGHREEGVSVLEGGSSSAGSAPGANLDAVLYPVSDCALFEEGEADWFRFHSRMVNDQGLATTGEEWGIAFRAGDQRFLQLRRLFASAVAFVGSGPGDPDLCTVAGREALRHCDACLYDALTPKELLDELPDGAEALYVGKRHGRHSMKQQEICRLLVNLARQGKRVVRLKGGDPGIFGRLAEEVAILEDYQLPYRIVFGVSSLMPATTGTGMFLTRRAVSRGFTVMTPRTARGTDPVDLHNRQDLPLIFFMAVGEIPRIVEQLLLEGRPSTQPAGVVFAASTENERLCRGTLGDIAERITLEDKQLPGLFIVGDTAAYTLDGQRGAFGGRRVMILGGESGSQATKQHILRLSGIPVVKSLFRQVPNPEIRRIFRALRGYDWIVLANRAEVHDFFALCWDVGVDLRLIPKIIACSPEVVAALQDFCLKPDLVFDQDVAGRELVKVLQPQSQLLCFQETWPVLPVREKMQQNNISLTSAPLFDYEVVPDQPLPKFDCLICHNAEVLSSFLHRWGDVVLEQKRVASASPRVIRLLQSHGCRPEDLVVCDSVGDAIISLAASYVAGDLAVLNRVETPG
jgi:uroporphyrin-III C-methyltransferase